MKRSNEQGLSKRKINCLNCINFIKIILSTILILIYVNCESQITKQPIVGSSYRNSIRVSGALEFSSASNEISEFPINYLNPFYLLSLNNSVNSLVINNGIGTLFNFRVNYELLSIQNEMNNKNEEVVDYTSDILNTKLSPKDLLSTPHNEMHEGEKLFVINTADTTKKFLIDSLEPLVIKRIEINNQSGNKTKHFDSGHIYDVYQDTVYLSRSFYTYEVYNSFLTYIYHSESPAVLNSTYNHTLSFDDNLVLQYSSSLRYSVHYFTKYIGLISFTSALIAAPLLSINYNEGGLNENRYFRTAGYSLSATALSAIIYLVTFDEEFELVKKGTTVNKNKWFLDYH